MVLERINGPEDLKGLTKEERDTLAREMRENLIQRASLHMGHVGPDLGFVEATIALHTVFDAPKDHLIFDVSHQTYPHKMLTGRKEAYMDPEHYDDVGPYTDPKESPYDLYSIGHTSTSVDLAIGMAKARDILGGKEHVVGIIGDGSLSGGMALEGLNVAGEMESPLILVLNDNNQSIAENHGGMYKKLTELRETNGEAKDNIFRGMGLEYLYEGNGNDVESLVQIFEKAKSYKRPVLVHIFTRKGMGLPYAEEHKEGWHWHMPFYRETGKTREEWEFGEDLSDRTADFLLRKMKKDPSILVITAGVPGGMGFTAEKRREAGERFIDTGIAEQSGVTLACGAAKRGAKALFFTSATFLQRAYDQISHDAGINSLPITIVVNSASLFGMSDKTHLGLYLSSMANSIPNLFVLAPAFKEEYFAMLDYSMEQRERPMLILAPSDVVEDELPVEKDFGKPAFRTVKAGKDVAIFAPGSIYGEGKAAVELLQEKYGITATLIEPTILSHLDEECLQTLKKEHKLVVVLEDGILDGGLGEKIARYYGMDEMRVLCVGLNKEFYDEYDVTEILKEHKMDRESIAEAVVKGLQ